MQDRGILTIIYMIKIYLLAPVQTIFPELNIKAVVLGSRILIITAANLCLIKTNKITLTDSPNIILNYSIVPYPAFKYSRKK